MVGCKYFSSCRLDIGRKDICHLRQRVGSNLWKQKMLRSHDVDKWKKCNWCLCLGKVKFLKQPTSPLVITSTFLHSHGFAWNVATTQCVIPESFWEGTFGWAAAVCGRVHAPPRCELRSAGCTPSEPDGTNGKMRLLLSQRHSWGGDDSLQHYCLLTLGLTVVYDTVSA